MNCWICGEKATRSRDISNPIYEYGEISGKRIIPSRFQRCYCDKCFDARAKQLKEENSQYILLKQKRLFEKAVDKLEHQHIDFIEYEEAIKAVEEYNLENLDKFDSSYEIMVAIELIQHQIRIKPQYKVGRYRTDFFLPDYNLVIEIDGERHKRRKEQDSDRDRAIKKNLPGVHIIRISTDNLDDDIKKLVKAVNAIMKYRKTGIWTTK